MRKISQKSALFHVKRYSNASGQKPTDRLNQSQFLSTKTLGDTLPDTSLDRYAS